MKKINKGHEYLTIPSKKIRDSNDKYRIKCSKFRVFYRIFNEKIVIFKIGEKDKNAYKGIKNE